MIPILNLSYALPLCFGQDRAHLKDSETVAWGIDLVDLNIGAQCWLESDLCFQILIQACGRCEALATSLFWAGLASWTCGLFSTQGLEGEPSSWINALLALP